MPDAKFLEPVLKSTTCEFSSIVTNQDSGYSISCHYVVHDGLLYSGSFLGRDGGSFCPSCEMVNTREEIIASTLIPRERSNQVYAQSVEGASGVGILPLG